jgi:hypothetical protein
VKLSVFRILEAPIWGFFVVENAVIEVGLGPIFYLARI